jgi:hypothetical protein
MLKVLRGLTVGTAVLVMSLAALGGTPAQAQQLMSMQSIDTPQRRAMQQCVSGVLSRLSRAKAAVEQVGPAVSQQCASQLRTVLAAEIRAGRTPCSSVEACLPIAQDHTTQQAIYSYQQRAR